MTFEEDLALTLVSIIIPTVLGIVTTKFVTENWQDRSAKYELQKTILEQIDETYTELAWDMFAVVYDEAIDVFGEENITYDEESKRISFRELDMVQFEEGFIPPIVKHNQRYQDIMNKCWIVEKNAEKMLSDIVIYFGRESFREERDRIYNNHELMFIDLVSYFRVTTPSDLKNRFDRFYERFLQQLTEIRRLKTSIVETQMKKRQI